MWQISSKFGASELSHRADEAVLSQVREPKSRVEYHSDQIFVSISCLLRTQSQYFGEIPCQVLHYRTNEVSDLPSHPSLPYKWGFWPSLTSFPHILHYRANEDSTIPSRPYVLLDCMNKNSGLSSHPSLPYKRSFWPSPTFCSTVWTRYLNFPDIVHYFTSENSEFSCGSADKDVKKV